MPPFSMMHRYRNRFIQICNAGNDNIMKHVLQIRLLLVEYKVDLR